MKFLLFLYSKIVKIFDISFYLKFIDNVIDFLNKFPFEILFFNILKHDYKANFLLIDLRQGVDTLLSMFYHVAFFNKGSSAINFIHI